MVFAPTPLTEPGNTSNTASVSTASIVSKPKDSQTGKKQSSGTFQCISLKDETMKAELIWAMKVVGSHYSYASCDNIKETLDAMFSVKIPNNFTMSSSKVSYLISEATGPYFKKIVADDVKNSGSPFTLAQSLGFIFPRCQSVSGHMVHAKMFPARSPRIRHRNELTQRDWENAVRGLGNVYPTV